MSIKNLEELELILFCIGCDEEIDELEAYKHSFYINGCLTYFHEECCPQVWGAQKCKSKHKEQ